MSTGLQSASMSGVYTRFDIENTLTGEVRSVVRAPNQITDMALKMFGNSDLKWHTFNRCFLTRGGFDTGTLDWGALVPSNSDPDDIICGLLIASEENTEPHSSIEKVDTGTELYLKASKSWTFRQGLEGSFGAVSSGILDTTTLTAEDGVLTPVESLQQPCPVTGLTSYQNWLLYIQSTAAILTDDGQTTELVLTPVDVLTVTHEMRIQLPKYGDIVTIPDVDFGDGVLREVRARPHVPAYDTLVAGNRPVTAMYYANSSELTAGYIPGLKQTISNGSFTNVGDIVITATGDYDASSQVTDEDGAVVAVMKHTLVLNPSDGDGEIGRLLVNGANAWYELQITPKLKKRNIDKLSLDFYFSWG